MSILVLFTNFGELLMYLLPIMFNIGCNTIRWSWNILSFTRRLRPWYDFLLKRWWSRLQNIIFQSVGDILVRHGELEWDATFFKGKSIVIFPSIHFDLLGDFLTTTFTYELTRSWSFGWCDYILYILLQALFGELLEFPT